MELRSAVGRSRAATNGRARNHRQCGNTWLAADPSAAIASRSACAGFDRTRRVCGNFWRRGRRILVTRMRLRCRPRIDSTGSESPLVRCRRTWFALWNVAPMPLHLRSLLYTSGASGLRTRSQRKPPSLECARRLSWRFSLSGFLSRDRPQMLQGQIARGTRKFSGVKYHRITGRGDEKQLYDRTAAENAAARHAIHFLEQCHQQIREIGEVGFEPIIVAPFDAELFGHWWFEGPIFLEQFIRHAASERDFRLTTPSEYLAAHPTQQIVEPAASTWGENGHLAVWLDPSNAWIYPLLNAAALRMCEVAGKYAAGGSNMTDTCDRVLKQLTRELLLAQSSDWAFLMKTGTAREYATQRTIDHLARFNRLHDQLVTNNLDEEFLHDCEWRDNIFPNVNWRYYA